jgi:hypothetical protein
LLKEQEGWITQKIIYDKIPLDYTFWDGVGSFHDSQARMEITKDVQEINNSDLPRIVLSSSMGIKIASRQEYKEWSERKWKSIKGMIKRLSYKDDKAGMDGQYRLNFEEKSTAKQFYDAFSESNEDITVDEFVSLVHVLGKIEG